MESLIMYGSAVKALGRSHNIGKLAGTLCLHSTADDPDNTEERDFFDHRTEFKMTDGMTTPIYYHHGLDGRLGVKQIGTGLLTRDAGGVRIAAEMDLQDPDAANIYDRAAAGELGWSSGTAAHLVIRESVATLHGTAHHIKFWPLGLDASLTPRPAEPRCVAVALKSLMGAGGAEITECLSVLREVTRMRLELARL